jgi:hypothetical protein
VSGRTIIEFKGIEEMRKELKELGRKYPEAAAEALYQEGLAIERASVPLVPVDTGRLRATHYVAPTADLGMGRLVTQVGYGADYALPVHERMSAHHESGQAKFLETPFKAAMGGMADRLAARIKANVEAGRGMKPVDESAIEAEKAKAEGAGAARGAKTTARRARSAANRKTRKANRSASRTARKAFGLRGSKGGT